MKVTSIDLSIIQTVIETPEERIIQHWGTGKMGGKMLMQSSQKLQVKAQTGQPAPTGKPKLAVAPEAQPAAAQAPAAPVQEAGKEPEAQQG